MMSCRAYSARRVAALPFALIVVFSGASGVVSAGGTDLGSVFVGLPADVRERIALEDTLPLSDDPYLVEGIKDPIFAYLVGLVERGRTGVVRAEHLKKALEKSGRKSRIPLRLIGGFARTFDSDHLGWTVAVFTESLNVPVPYSILGYHPGRLVSSRDVAFCEFRLDEFPVTVVDGEGEVRLVRPSNVSIWGLVSGRVILDIDGLVDAVMGSRIDDFLVVGLALFELDGCWYGMALGFNRRGEGRSGVLNLQADKIPFPMERRFKVLGRRMRSYLLAQMSLLGFEPMAALHLAKG